MGETRVHPDDPSGMHAHVTGQAEAVERGAGVLGVPASPGRWGWDPCRWLNAGRRYPQNEQRR
jgi:hypothetical protein